MNIKEYYGDADDYPFLICVGEWGIVIRRTFERKPRLPYYMHYHSKGINCHSDGKVVNRSRCTYCGECLPPGVKLALLMERIKYK